MLMITEVDEVQLLFVSPCLLTQSNTPLSIRMQFMVPPLTKRDHPPFQLSLDILHFPFVAVDGDYVLAPGIQDHGQPFKPGAGRRPPEISLFRIKQKSAPALWTRVPYFMTRLTTVRETRRCSQRR